MTIQNYTFFSPTGTEFPVSATADRRLYMMLSDMDYSGFRIRTWSSPTNTGLNRIYNDNSLILGGAYFELKSEAVVLNSSTSNYIHANIDLSNPDSPVSLTVEETDNSNTIDINSKTGVLKRCFEVVVTNATTVETVKPRLQDNLLTRVYPVGAYYMSSQETEPATLFGFGIWERIKGRTLVGVDESDSALATAGIHGGSTNPLTAHSHGASKGQFVVSVSSKAWASGASPTASYAEDTATATSSAGSNTNHANWQPFETAYVWKRTA